GVGVRVQVANETSWQRAVRFLAAKPPARGSIQSGAAEREPTMRAGVVRATPASQLGGDAASGAASAVGKRTLVDEAGQAPHGGAAHAPGKQTRVDAEGAA